MWRALGGTRSDSACPVLAARPGAPAVPKFGESSPRGDSLRLAPSRLMAWLGHVGAVRSLGMPSGSDAVVLWRLLVGRCPSTFGHGATGGAGFRSGWLCRLRENRAAHRSAGVAFSLRVNLRVHPAGGYAGRPKSDSFPAGVVAGLPLRVRSRARLMLGLVDHMESVH